MQVEEKMRGNVGQQYTGDEQVQPRRCKNSRFIVESSHQASDSSKRD